MRKLKLRWMMRLKHSCDKSVAEACQLLLNALFREPVKPRLCTITLHALACICKLLPRLCMVLHELSTNQNPRSPTLHPPPPTLAYKLHAGEAFWSMLILMHPSFSRASERITGRCGRCHRCWERDSPNQVIAVHQLWDCERFFLEVDY